MIVSRTPCRISLFGGGTDFEDYWKKDGGAVLNLAVNKYIYVIVKKNHDGLIHLSHYAKEVVSDLNEIEHDIIRECLRYTEVSGGVDLCIMSDIPNSGSGLGSSSSLTVGLLNALYTYTGSVKTAAQLAKAACKIEIEILGQPIGIQDQYIAAYGGIRFMEFLPDGQVKVNKMKMDDAVIENLNNHINLFFTGINRQANTILSEQKYNIEEKRFVLDQIKEQAVEGRKLLLENDMRGIGKLLTAGWLKKKGLASKITNPHIDEIINKVHQAQAYGSKIAGAGGGGFVLIISPPENRAWLQKSLRGLKSFGVSAVEKGSEIVYPMISGAATN